MDLHEASRALLEAAAFGGAGVATGMIEGTGQDLARTVRAFLQRFLPCGGDTPPTVQTVQPALEAALEGGVVTMEELTAVLGCCRVGPTQGHNTVSHVNNAVVGSTIHGGVHFS